MDNEPISGSLSRSDTDYLEFEEEKHQTSSEILHVEEAAPNPPKMSLKSGSNFFATSGGREMLDLMDRLRSIDKVNTTIPLPQIIVVGQQSSGKSSVLNAISGIQFPVGQGTVTRFPTEIVLRRTAHSHTTASIRHGSTYARPESFNEFEDRWRSQNIALDRLPEVITDATTTLNIGGTTPSADATLDAGETIVFVDATLVLEICGPEQENLTLIDLPGLIIATSGDQHSTDIEMVGRIVERYMANERAIMLAVFTGRYDFENQVLVQKLKDNPQYAARSLGVVTGPDMIDSESHLESRYTEHVKNRVLKLHHGWHVLRNLKSQEVAQGLSRNEVEREFFATQKPWCDEIDRNQVGSHALKERLSEILQSSIAEALPEIGAQLRTVLGICERERELLGDDRSSPLEQRKYLLRRAQGFKDEVKNSLDGTHQLGRLASTNMALRARIRLMGRLFSDDMEQRGRSWNIVSGQSGSEAGKQLFNYIDEVVLGENAKSTKDLREHDMLRWLSEQIRRNQGPEPPNLVNPQWAGKLFQSQTRKWKDLAQTHLDHVFDTVKREIMRIVANNYKDVSGPVLRKLVLPGMNQLKLDLDAKLAELCKPYRGQYPQTLSKRYLASLEVPNLGNLDGSESNSTTKFANYDSCRQILRTVDAFYEICSETFMDNIQTLAIEHCLLDELEALAGTETIGRMTDREMDEIAGESPEVKQRRERLDKDIEQYKKATTELLPALELKTLGRFDVPDTDDVSDHYAARLAKYHDLANEEVFAEVQDFTSTERQETRQQATSPMQKSDSNSSADTHIYIAPKTPQQPASGKKTRRRVKDDGSPPETGAGSIARDASPSPSAVFSSRGDTSTLSSLSSYQGSPQPPTKYAGLPFTGTSRLIVNTSEEEQQL